MVVDDESASIGMGAMITFITIMLISAIISSVLLIMVDKLFSENQNSSDEHQSGGKIIVDNILLYLYEPCWQWDGVPNNADCSDAPAGNQQPWGHHQLLMYFHLAPGSGTIPAENVHYLFHCKNEGGIFEIGNSLRGSDFTDSGTFSSRHSAIKGLQNTALERGQVLLQEDRVTGVNDIKFGEKYVIMLAMYDNKNTATDSEHEGCRITPNYDTTLLLFIDGGGHTEILLKFPEYTPGSVLF